MAQGIDKKSKPTAADLEAAHRLYEIWRKARKDRGITQDVIMDQWANDEAGESITQGGISQYLHGKIALNLPAVIRFARILGCAPDKIRSDLPGFPVGRAGEPAVSENVTRITKQPTASWPFSFEFERYSKLPPAWRQKCEGAALAIVQEFEAAKKSRGVPKPKQRNLLKKVSRA